MLPTSLAPGPPRIHIQSASSLQIVPLATVRPARLGQVGPAPLFAGAAARQQAGARPARNAHSSSNPQVSFVEGGAGGY